ncbi:MAG: Sialic acid-binding periplasmic protein SiaP precursor [Syntrophorhabdaceae bacterium PtaU1.Bin034]|jgi:TRAP-type C4-dicarboxylate transport system substrate-binding protein|nr:MAG: Sialic acid-binding periplasmic protein SiaP precursor [Syntrophorhabdaceae bacterium PtaU1.Bin034]
MKRGFWLALFIGVAFLISPFASTGFAQEKVITLKYTNFFPAPHANSIITDQWSREVEKRTNGRVKINYYPGATLTPANQTYDSVVRGIADIGTSCQAYTRGKFPLTEVVDLPLGYKSGLVATRMINEFYKKFKPKEYDDVQVMYLHAHGPGILHTKNKAVHKLEDVKGLKIRSTGLSAKVVQALGGAPVGMPMTESYDALSKGVAEGILCPDEALKGFKLGEVTSFTTESYPVAYSTSFFVVMNKAKWNSLPKDIQGIIQKINEEWVEKQGKIWDDIDKEGKTIATQQGMKYIKLSPEEGSKWVAKVRPILDEYVQGTKKRGLPGDAALSFCLDYLKTHQK